MVIEKSTDIDMLSKMLQAVSSQISRTEDGVDITELVKEKEKVETRIRELAN